MSSTSNEGVPSTVTDAVLVPSNEMPKDAQKVEELDFNKFAGRPITIDDLMSGMNHMGFQASSIGEAVRIINNMVHYKLSSLNASKLTTPREHGKIPKLVIRQQYSLAIPQISSLPAFEVPSVT